MFSRTPAAQSPCKCRRYAVILPLCFALGYIVGRALTARAVVNTSVARATLKRAEHQVAAIQRERERHDANQNTQE